MEEYLVQFRKLCQTKTRRLVLLMGMIVSSVLVFQTFTLPSRSSHFSPETEATVLSEPTSSPSPRVGKFPLSSDARNSKQIPVTLEVVESAEVSGNNDMEAKQMDGSSEKDDTTDDSMDLDEDGDLEGQFSFDLGDGFILKKTRDPLEGFVILERIAKPQEAPQEKVREQGHGLASVSDGVNKLVLPSVLLEENKIPSNEIVIPPDAAVPTISPLREKEKKIIFLLEQQEVIETLHKNESKVTLKSGLHGSSDNSTGSNVPLVKRKKRVKPPISISEMDLLLLRNRASYHTMRPRWSSSRDQQMLAVKAQIENAAIVKNDRQLYAPAFRNISMFKRSYELMERTLRVYVYKEGEKPIFHQPLLKGIYASEGWFMKLMEGNRRFVVKDPRKAHLFYMPFSSRLLQFALYVPNSHKQRNLEQALKDYVDMIAAKYRFWNRTGGADHFLAACHDWAAYETRHAMGHSIRAICNADLHEGFRLGKDVSLPETYVRSAKDPLRDLGGRPANQRPTLAFFAGNMHGRLRPILLQHWENKDPDMKIFGPMPRGVQSKMTYIQHMKSSKYCICPRGYEVNSPRVVESIFYECVPVIISDSYVPAFFDVLNWEAFSVIIPEADIPRLKEILLSIPDEKYQALQMGVKRVQQHFLWHSKPVKYDLFHMILHNIWLNRVYQVQTR